MLYQQYQQCQQYQNKTNRTKRSCLGRGSFFSLRWIGKRDSAYIKTLELGKNMTDSYFLATLHINFQKKPEYYGYFEDFFDLA